MKDDTSSKPTPDQPRPFAYDSEGRPLYAVPPIAPSGAAGPAPQFVHVSRPFNPAKVPVDAVVREKHDASVKAYPFLNLSEGEFIVADVRRHSIGLVVPVGAAIFIIALIGSFVINYPIIMRAMGVEQAPAYGSIVTVGFLLCLLLAIGTYAAVWVYHRNRLFLTNESLIQEIQTSLFTQREQTVSLENVEDASYFQGGIIQSLFDYGTLRLSTEGEESTYQFDYAANPKKQVAILNNAVEAFKNGRPVGDTSDIN